MLDLAPFPHQRARGRAAVALSAGPRGTVLTRLGQAGCAKAFLPRVHAPDPEVVFLNTAGGVTGGDRLSYAGAIGAGGRATFTTQTAERAYRSTSGRARIEVDFTVGPGAHLDWLPQETILFDGAAVERETTIRLEGDATCLAVETVVLGRAAMGEAVAVLDFADRRRVLRDGTPVVIEPLTLGAGALERRSAAGLGAARALASLVLVAPGAADALGPVRAALVQDGVTAAASAWDGRLAVRAMAGDAFPLRRLTARLLTLLRGRPLPRVWQL